LPSLTLTIGLPGSGKTTEAIKIRRLNPDVVLVSRDALRAEFFGEFTDFNPEQEALVTSISQKAVDKALEQGRDVIVHDMNLRKKYRKDWAGYAVKHNADFQYIDLTGKDPKECIQRDWERGVRGGRSVGPDFILAMHKRYLSNKQPLEAPDSLIDEIKWVPEGNNPYRYTPGLPEAIIVDIDGTVASHEGVRGPYDTTKYHLDEPRWDVIKVVQDYAYRNIPKKILFVSGRDAKFREVTYEWLMHWVKVPIEGLFMRPEGDTRRDDIVKLELFDEYIRGKYNIWGVFDDRDRVVKAWRSIQLPTFQVNEGNF
jgi:predicted kinase